MNFLQKWSPQLLSMLRIMSALLFLEHGTAKLFGFPVRVIDHLQLFSLWGGIGVLEVVGGTLLLLGLFSRATAFILSGEMAVGYFWIHATKSLFPLVNLGDPPILFCFIFLYIAAAGPGPWSLDLGMKRG